MHSDSVAQVRIERRAHPPRRSRPAKQPQHRLTAIGSATAQADEIEGYVWVSEERLRLLLTAAQSGQLQFAHFAGPKLRYGGAIVNSVSVGTHFNEDDW